MAAHITQAGNMFRFFDLKNDKTVESIKRYPLFQDMSEDEIAAFAKRCYIRHYNAEEEIYPEGSTAAAIYFLVSGSVGLYKKRRSGVTDRLQVIPSGKFFGDSSLISNDVRKNSSRALERTEVLVLFKNDFHTLEQIHPRLALKLLKMITNKFYNELLIFQTEFHELSQKIAGDELKK